MFCWEIARFRDSTLAMMITLLEQDENTGINLKGLCCLVPMPALKSADQYMLCKLYYSGNDVISCA